jgi:hypothetical protein
MAPKTKILTFRPDEEAFAAMEALRERDGVPYSEQIRRALKVWLEQKAVYKPVHQSAGTRRKTLRLRDARTLTTKGGA